MDEYLHRTWKTILKTNWLPVALLIALPVFFLASCVNSAGELEVEGYPAQLNQLQTPSPSQGTLSSTSPSSRSTPDWTPTTISVLTSTSEPSPTTTPIVDTATPTLVPTVTPSLTPTPVILPQLLIVAIEVRHKGEVDEIHEIWTIDTLTEEKRLVFTTTAGTRLTRTMWGGERSDILYVTEIKGVGEGHITWQLYEVNYQTGSSRALFEGPLEGLPRLYDTSAKGRWLRMLVEYPVSQSPDETWFLNTEDNRLIKTNQHTHYFSGFVWSPHEPDVFAYSQESAIDDNMRIPQRVVISDVTNFEVLDAIDYKYTNWGGEPWLVWHVSEPDQILFVILGEMYAVDLVEKDWIQIAQNLDVFPGHGYMTKSPSGKWLVNTAINIRVILLDNAPRVVKRFENKITQRHVFLSWYNDKDWIVIATLDDKVQIYELGDNFDLLREINLNDYGFDSPGSFTILAKPLNN